MRGPEPGGELARARGDELACRRDARGDFPGFIGPNRDRFQRLPKRQQPRGSARRCRGRVPRSNAGLRPRIRGTSLRSWGLPGNRRMDRRGLAGDKHERRTRPTTRVEQANCPDQIAVARIQPKSTRGRERARPRREARLPPRRKEARGCGQSRGQLSPRRSPAPVASPTRPDSMRSRVRRARAPYPPSTEGQRRAGAPNLIR